ncbi:hypothetical protein QWY28_21615 [Nocardioides sp. SOB77]|uniref:Uncharacterized protein n=1 Tax=Nocardioides oceani TaxID=3058369 RepID=A0ABT8FLM1_9ACTN|nr:hypothetical protein [Nocardioides oceani]MDN4175576.1 hypothetical protein [Nocardioides oceani]
MLADANALWREREAALVAAKEAVAYIENGWRRGDDTATAADLVNAQAEVTRCLSLIDGARFAAQRAKRGLVNDDPTLAASVVHALGGMLNGIPVKPLTVEPTVPDATDLPVAYVVDTNPETNGRSGEVEIVVYGPSYLGKPDGEAVAETMRKGGTSTDRLNTPRFHHAIHGDVHEYRAAFRVTRALPEYPHWSDVKEDASKATHDLAYNFGDYINVATAPTRIGIGSPLRIGWDFVSGRVLSSKPAGDGLTDNTVEIDMDLGAGRGVQGLTKSGWVEIRNDIQRDAARYLRDWAAIRAPHVQSAKMVRTDEGGGLSVINVRLTLTVRSRDNALTLADVDQ